LSFVPAAPLPPVPPPAGAIPPPHRLTPQAASAGTKRRQKAPRLDARNLMSECTMDFISPQGYSIMTSGKAFGGRIRPGFSSQK
jgi:hypothetical protein